MKRNYCPQTPPAPPPTHQPSAKRQSFSPSAPLRAVYHPFRPMPSLPKSPNDKIITSLNLKKSSSSYIFTLHIYLLPSFSSIAAFKSWSRSLDRSLPQQARQSTGRRRRMPATERVRECRAGPEVASSYSPSFFSFSSSSSSSASLSGSLLLLLFRLYNSPASFLYLLIFSSPFINSPPPSSTLPPSSTSFPLFLSPCCPFPLHSPTPP